MARPKANINSISARERLLEAAISVMRQKGYTATTVDDLCEHAKVTKGTFFHYFETKESLAVAAANYWSTTTTQLFTSADYQKHSDPLKRLLGYIDFRKQILKGELVSFTCFVGTLVQETYDSSPAIQKACRSCIFGHTDSLMKDIEAAKKKYCPKAKWTSRSLALHTQAVLQGSFILAKSDDGPEVAIETVSHLKNYIQMLFNQKK